MAWALFCFLLLILIMKFSKSDNRDDPGDTAMFMFDEFIDKDDK